MAEKEEQFLTVPWTVDYLFFSVIHWNGLVQYYMIEIFLKCIFLAHCYWRIKRSASSTMVVDKLIFPLANFRREIMLCQKKISIRMAKRSILQEIFFWVIFLLSLNNNHNKQELFLFRLTSFSFSRNQSTMIWTMDKYDEYNVHDEEQEPDINILKVGGLR